MKKLLIPLIIVSSALSVFAQKAIPKLAKSSTQNEVKFSSATLIANKIGYPITNIGLVGYNPNSNASIYFTDPKNLLGYAEGIVWGGFFPGDSPNSFRIGGSTYASGLKPGKILTNGNEANNFTPVADDPTLEKYRVYKIRKNWESLPEGSEKAQFQKDYAEWPIADGAPVNDDGTPKFLGDETAFYVANDLTSEGTSFLYGSVPIGIEMQSTVWASSDTIIDKVIFRTVKLINKSGKNISNFMIGIWADPDIIDALNDRISFDNRNGIMTAFTDQDTWKSEKIKNNLNQAIAFSYELISPDKNDFSTAWTNYGTDNNDPIIGEISGAIQMYRNLTGFKSSGSNYIDPESNLVTFQPFGGDAITNSGYTDQNTMQPSDKRMMMSFKANSFNAGEAFTFTYAISVNEGTSPVEALYHLRSQPKNHKYAALTNSIPFGTHAVYNSAEEKIRIQIGDYSAVGIKVYLKDTENTDFIADGIQLYDDGTHGDVTASDHLFSAEISIAPELKNLHVDVSVIYSDKSVLVKNWITDFEIYKALNNAELVVISDNINNNGKIENGETVNYQIKIQSETDIELKKVKIVADESSEQIITSISESSAQSILTGFNSIPQTGSFSFSIPLELDFNENGEFNSSITAFSKFENGSIIPFIVPVKIQKIGLSMNMILTKKISGNLNSGVFGARTYGKLTLNDDYRIKVSADPVFEYDSVKTGYENYQLEVSRLSTNTILANSTTFPDFYGFNQPIFDNILLTKGNASTKTQVKMEKTAGINLQGFGYGSFGFEGESSYKNGLEFGYRFHGSSLKDFANDLPSKIEIRFPDGGGQFSFVYDRGGNPAGIGIFTGYAKQLYEVWDMTDENNPRQLNTLIMENYLSASHDEIWSPTLNNLDCEYLIILNSTYDGNAPDQSGTNHIDYTNFRPLKKLNGNLFDCLFGLWLVKVNPDLPPYLAGDKITINVVPPVANGDEFTFNSVHLEKVTGVEDEIGKPGKFELSQNFPNPFNPSTVINYSVPTAGAVNFEIYNMLGQRVWSTSVNHVSAGNYKIQWNGKDSVGKSAASGIYLYSLQMNNSKITKKMMLVK